MKELSIIINRENRLFSIKNHLNILRLCMVFLWIAGIVQQSLAQCGSISTLPCSQVIRTIPVNLTFGGAEGGLLNTGFTMTDPPSARISADGAISNATVPGYEPSRLSISGGRLIIQSNKGIAYLKPSGTGLTSTETNSQINTMGVAFDADNHIVDIQTRIVNPYTDTTPQSEQAGLWFGLNEANFFKLVVINTGTVQLRREINNNSTETSTDVVNRTSVTNLHTSIVTLRMRVNITNLTITGFYRLNQGSEVTVGTLALPANFLNGVTVNGQKVSFAGIFATKRRASSSTLINYSFEDFSIVPVNQPPVVTANQRFTIDVTKVVDNAVIGTVKATDVNNNITNFKIISGNTSNFFAINSLGVLTIADHHATIGVYSLGIQAIDSQGLTGSATVVVEIVNSSTNLPPVLVGTTFNVPNTAQNQYIIGQIRATDPDAQAGDPPLTYMLHHIEINGSTTKIPANQQTIFALSSTGTLSLIGASQIALGNTYKLHIMATDSKGGRGEAHFMVNIVSASAPVIASQTFSVVEGSPTNTIVGNVVASDSDGSIANYEITAAQFLINPPMPSSNSNLDTQYNPLNVFSINATSGQLRVNNPKYLLNVLGPIQLTVRVRDSQALTASANITVNVLDMTVSIAQNHAITWTTVAPHPDGHSEATGGALGDRLYVFGGYQSTTPKSSVHVYTPATDSWARLANMPPMSVNTTFGGATHMGYTDDGTNIYIGAGYAATSTGTGQVFGSTRVYKYVVATNTYQELPRLPENRAAGGLAYINGKLYYFGGTNLARTADQGNLYMLDLANNATSWVQRSMMPNPRNHLGHAIYNGKLYVFGGQKEHDGKLVPQDDVHIYDPVTDTWRHVTDMPRAFNHIGASIFTYGDYIFSLGGQIGHAQGYYKDVYAYHPPTNTWIRFTDLPVGRMSAVVGVIGGRIYLSGSLGSKTTYAAYLPSQFVVNPLQARYILQVTAENGGSVNNLNGSYPAGTNISLQATPNSGFVFDKWVNANGQTVSTANSYQFAINTNTTLRAIFRQNISLTLNIDDENNNEPILDGNFITNYATHQNITTIRTINNHHHGTHTLTEIGAKHFAMTNENIKVYPNPFSDVLSIELKNAEPDEVNLLFYNNLGQLVNVTSFTWEKGKNIKEIGTDYLSSGIYFVHVQTSRYTKIMKIIKL